MSDVEDDDLFKQEMEGVKPIQVVPPVVTHPSSSSPSDAQLARRRSATAALDQDENTLTSEYVEMVDPHDILEFKRPGVQEGVYRKLRLGKYETEAALDLHRKTVEESRQEVFGFIQECSRLGLRTVMILHGKGEKTKGKTNTQPALLKSYVNKWLPSLPQVLAFHNAQRQDGGAGAMYILLKKNEQKKQENRERHLRGH